VSLGGSTRAIAYLGLRRSLQLEHHLHACFHSSLCNQQRFHRCFHSPMRAKQLGWWLAWRSPSTLGLSVAMAADRATVIPSALTRSCRRVRADTRARGPASRARQAHQHRRWSLAHSSPPGHPARLVLNFAGMCARRTAGGPRFRRACVCDPKLGPAVRRASRARHQRAVRATR
jgi:hypothetical protein